MLGMWSRCASDSVYVASIYLDVVWYCMTRGRKKAINGFLSSDFKKKAAQFPRFIPGREVVPTSVQMDFALSVHPKPRSLSDLRFVYLLFVSASALSLVFGGGIPGSMPHLADLPNASRIPAATRKSRWKADADGKTRR